MDNTLIEFFMGHAIGDEVKTYINMPGDELRELYQNYEHLLSIEKTSLDEQAEKQGPQINEKAFNSLVQQVAELSRSNAETKAELSEIKEQLRLVYEAMRKSE